MENLFLKVLSMSATASAVILLVLLARLLLRRAPKVFSYALWAVVLFRLLCPVTFDSVFALAPAVQIRPREAENLDAVMIDVEQREVTITVGDAPAYDPTLAKPVTANVPSQPQTRPDPEPGEAAPAAAPAAGPAFTPWTVVSAVWLAGAALLLGYSLVSLLRLRRRLVGSVPLEGEKNVRLADHIPSPFVLGVFRPSIYLPSNLRSDERDYILLHERTHIRRFDHIFRALAWLAVAVHWFNPLVWLAFHLAGKDMEMSCDEAVLRKMGAGIRADYSSSLLRLSVGGKLPAGPLAFGAGDPTGRIKNVLGYKKPALWVTAAALLLVLSACTALAANPGAAARPSEPDTAPFPDLTADLTFSLEQRDGRAFVRMDGTVGDVELPRGAFWYPEPSAFENFPDGYLSVVYPAFTDGIEGSFLAGWTDESHTSVTLSTQMQAMLSSQFNVGWWEFTVDLTSGAVTEMTACPFRVVQTESGHISQLNDKTRMYPESISDWGAVKAACVAAKLLTAAEDYYNNNHNSATEDLYAALPDLYAKVLRGESKFVLYKNEPPISIDEVPAIIDPYDTYMCLQRYAVVDLLGGLGSNETPQVLVYFGGVAGDMAGYLLLWDEDGEVHGEIFDSHGWRNRWFIDLKTDGTFECTDALGGQDWMSISYLRPTAGGSWALQSQAVCRALDSSGNEINLESFMTIDQELTEQEFEQALEIQRAKPDVIWHGGFPLKGYDGNPAPTQPIAPIDPPNLDGLFFSDGWNESVNIEGLDVKEMYWYSPSQYSPQGRLFFTNPAFLGPAFAGRTVQGDATWTNDSHTLIEINWGWDNLSYQGFSVDLDSGKVKCNAVWDGLTDEDLLAVGQTFSLLMEQAEAYKTSAAYRPAEDGPLPFDRPMELEFLSGAGAWQTHLLLHPDGSFEGDYEDADMTIHYVCQFHGRFRDITQVTDTSWSLTLDELVLDTKYPIGQEWDEGPIHYISSDPYGFSTGDGGPLKSGAQFMLYTPDARWSAPGDDLYGMSPDNEDYDSIMYQFFHWMPSSRRDAWDRNAALGCYGLCSMETGYGFFSD